MHNYTQLNTANETNFDVNAFINIEEELVIEELLDDDEAIQELKTKEDFQLIAFFTPKVIRQLIDYAITMPKEDDIKIGYKFPFNACEILCCNNNTIIELLLKEINYTKTIKAEKIPQAEEYKDIEEINHSDSKEDPKDGKTESDELLKESEHKDDGEDYDYEEGEVCKDKPKEQVLNNENEPSLVQDCEISKENNNEDNENEEKQEEIYILDYLFSFIQSPMNNDNYVLCGYFYKIAIHFLDISPSLILKYLYEDHPEHLKNCIRLLTNKSIGDLVLKLLTNEDSFPKYDTNKIELITVMINELKQSQDSELYEFTMDMFTNSLASLKLYDLILSESSNLLELLLAIMSNSSIPNNVFNSICNFLIKVNQLILSSFPTQVTQKKQDEPSALCRNTPQNSDCPNNDEAIEKEASLAFNLQLLFKLLKQNGFSFLSDLGDFSHKSDDDLLQTTFCQKQKRLGMKKLIQVEYIKSILEIIVNSNSKNYYKESLVALIQLMIKGKVFQSLIDIFFKYDMNNLYQTCFRQIISICINQHSPVELIEGLFAFNSIDFNSKLIEHLSERRNFKYNSKREINSCSLSVMNAVYNEIMNTSNSKLKEMIANQRDTIAFNEIVITAVTSIFSRTLLLSESSSTFLDHFDSDHKEEDNVKYSLFSLREILEQHLSIYNEYKKGGDYKQLLLAKILKERESVIDLNYNLNINLDLNDENIFEKRASFENKGNSNNDLICGNSDINFDESNRPFQIMPDCLPEETKKVKIERKEDDEEEEYYDNHYWKTSSVNDEVLSSLLKDLNI